MKRVFLYDILSALLKNKLDREKDMFYENFKNNKKYSKNFIIFSSNLNHINGLEKIEIRFYLFLEKLKRIKFSFRRHQSRISWNFQQKVIAKTPNRCKR